MGKGFYPRLREILIAYNCQYVRQGKGSHEIWMSPISKKSFSVPFTIVSKHTANAILQQAGINTKV
ncbi:TPA: type II toxin-antitoxin system HicA family toxin [Yersinia enterocolitica]|uniref:type II toxin-antitoxin system HicA family toxin n=1 Tax=Yersinia enterocolitica TaxID=630 RepID=UPI0005195EF3|nr:type II toxin-antitoxin system HicA family toxin [Yersinia enterocolitica]HDL7604573.1 type II toxin-antitoxin system HicA family toxin [Yersinia enterocolitica]HDL7641142.1 type II toxin-antitoxin system HicA family toxin [Yersinia enterocolitica]HDL7653937.1 type II toxin-antitoxin system HicA family toxin [Yersinia enterocolitica]HDL7691778.1 type II toxin-antitoxin system HicA family toxin [Yersinia enterocolitica]HDL7757260.1 type II toxin-antitoxin system HicA family toxin [Yersinia e